MKDFASLLLEARDPKTDCDKLWEIKDSGLARLDQPERSGLISALVDHPNSDEDLCIELLREWPNETLTCTRFQLLLLADSAISWDDVFDEIFEEFSEIVPALASLASIPKLHKPTIRLFTAELLKRLDDLSCTFDWNMSCTHEVSIDWRPGQSEDANNEEDEDEEVAQEFSITCSATIDNGNHAILRAPDKIDNIKALFAELDSDASGNEWLWILTKHGWDCEDDTTGGGGYFDIESVEPDLDGWEFSASLMGDASGTLCITDPLGVEHECELPEGDIEDSLEDYTLEDNLSLLELFDNNKDALDAFRKIISATVGMY